MTRQVDMCYYLDNTNIDEVVDAAKKFRDTRNFIREEFEDFVLCEAGAIQYHLGVFYINLTEIRKREGLFEDSIKQCIERVGVPTYLGSDSSDFDSDWRTFNKVAAQFGKKAKKERRIFGSHYGYQVVNK